MMHGTTNIKCTVRTAYYKTDAKTHVAEIQFSLEKPLKHFVFKMLGTYRRTAMQQVITLHSETHKLITV